MIEFRCLRVQPLTLAIVSIFLLALPLRAGWAAPNTAGSDAASSTCNSSEQTSYPKASISNGQVNAVVYLPDPKTGYYRGTRFDWSGVVGCLAYKGHTYFGVWFPKYDPYLNDAISGPVEDFRSADAESSLGYDQAKPGDPFVKLGVGVLRKVDDKPYVFSTTYPMIDPGKWTVHTRPASVSFQQTLSSPIGIAYVYKKTLKLDPREPVLILQHELKNTGTETIETQVYNHDFYVLDNAPTGPEMAVRFPFMPQPKEPLTNGARIEGKELVYDRELQTGEFAYTHFSGFSSALSDFDISVENRKTGVGVEETGDLPLSRVVFWSIRTTICPEAYVHLKIAPGETAHWSIRYRFYAK
jgi:hypothetical protein